MYIPPPYIVCPITQSKLTYHAQTHSLISLDIGLMYPIASFHDGASATYQTDTGHHHNAHIFKEAPRAIKPHNIPILMPAKARVIDESTWEKLRKNHKKDGHLSTPILSTCTPSFVRHRAFSAAHGFLFDPHIHNIEVYDFNTMRDIAQFVFGKTIHTIAHLKQVHGATVHIHSDEAMSSPNQPTPQQPHTTTLSPSHNSATAHHLTQELTGELTVIQYEGDALITQKKGVMLIVKTADCLPVLFVNASRTVVAAAHGGWQGLFSGILHNTVRKLKTLTDEPITACIGPYIHPKYYDIGDDFYEARLKDAPESRSFFHHHRTINSSSQAEYRWHFDIQGFALQQLKNHGIMAQSTNYNTYNYPFSSRRRALREQLRHRCAPHFIML